MKPINALLTNPASRVSAAAVLAKATARSAVLLGLSGAALSRVIGVSEPTVSRLLNGDRPLNPESKEGELAALLVRVFGQSMRWSATTIKSVWPG